MHYIYAILLLLTFYYPLLDLEPVRYLYFVTSIWYFKKVKLIYSSLDLFRIILISTCICIFIHDIWPLLWDFFISLNVTSSFDIHIFPFDYIPKKKLYTIGGIISALNYTIILIWYIFYKCIYFFFKQTFDVYKYKKLYDLGIVVMFFTFIMFNFIYLSFNNNVYSYIFLQDIYLSFRYR